MKTEAHFYDAEDYRPDLSVGYLMAGITAAMRRRIEPRMAALGLTATQWKPLWALDTGRASTAQELTCMLHAMDPGAMTRLLDRLEAKGLVERVRSTDDRRVVRLRLTDAGREVARQIPAVLAEVNDAGLRRFSPAEFEQLKSLLQRMKQTLDEDETTE
jgi:DNA-binding MarR family transcriptional regulator